MHVELCVAWLKRHITCTGHARTCLSSLYTSALPPYGFMDVNGCSIISTFCEFCLHHRRLRKLHALILLCALDTHISTIMWSWLHHGNHTDACMYDFYLQTIWFLYNQWFHSFDHEIQFSSIIAVLFSFESGMYASVLNMFQCEFLYTFQEIFTLVIYAILLEGNSRFTFLKLSRNSKFQKCVSNVKLQVFIQVDNEFL